MGDSGRDALPSPTQERWQSARAWRRRANALEVMTGAGWSDRGGNGSLTDRRMRCARPPAGRAQPPPRRLLPASWPFSDEPPPVRPCSRGIQDWRWARATSRACGSRPVGTRLAAFQRPAPSADARHAPFVLGRACLNCQGAQRAEPRLSRDRMTGTNLHPGAASQVGPAHGGTSPRPRWPVRRGRSAGSAAGARERSGHVAAGSASPEPQIGPAAAA